MAFKQGATVLKPAGLPRLAYLTLLSHPKQDRRIFRMIHQSQVHSILELGIGSGVRTSRMIELLGRQRGSQNPRYIGVAFFEARPANAPGLTIKRAHQLFANSGVDVRLIPGDPCSVLARTANGLGTIDLVVIGAAKEPFFKKMLFGEIPEKVARYSPSSVLVVKKFEGVVKSILKKVMG